MRRSAIILGLGLAVVIVLLLRVDSRMEKNQRQQVEAFEAFTAQLAQLLDRLGPSPTPLEIGGMRHTYEWTSGGQRKALVVTKDEHGAESVADFEARAAAEYAAAKVTFRPDVQ